MTDTSADFGDDQSQGSEQFDAFTEEEESLENFPPDVLMGAQAYGAGGTETQDGVVERMARENPDVPVPGDADPVAGIMDVDDPMGDDLTAESVAEVGDETGALSPEEAAMHAYSADEAVAHGLDLDGPAHDGYYDDEGSTNPPVPTDAAAEAAVAADGLTPGGMSEAGIDGTGEG